jgi:hypothetical protein
MISNIHKNCMGTCSFDAQFKGMRKAQDFDVYPMQAGDATDRIKIQSDTRIGYVLLTTGQVLLSKPHANGAHCVNPKEIVSVDTLSGDDLITLKMHLLSSASKHAGTNGVMYCDNSAAANVFSNAGPEGEGT